MSLTRPRATLHPTSCTPPPWYPNLLLPQPLAILAHASYELFLLNNEDRDARDILNAYKQTLPGIQGHHAFFQLATQPVDQNISEILTATLMSFQGPVAVYYFGLANCMQTVSLPCLSSTGASPSAEDAEYPYPSFQDWLDGLPESAALVVPLLGSGAEQWDASRLANETWARWDEFAARSCSRRVDICKQFDALIPEAIAAAQGTLPILRLYDAQGRVPRVEILRDGTETSLVFDPRRTSPPTFSRTQLLAFFTQAARTLDAAPEGYAGTPHPLTDVAVDGTSLFLVEGLEEELSDIDVKAASFLPALYFMKSSCADTSYKKFYLETQQMVWFEAYPYSSTTGQGGDGSTSPTSPDGSGSSSQGSQRVMEVSFWNQTRQLPLYRVEENYDLQKLNVSKLLAVTITVGLVSLGSPVFNGSGYWQLVSVEGEYDTPVEVNATTLEDGSLAPVPGVAIETSSGNVVIQVRDLSEPDTPALAEFRGSWRQVVMVGAGGLGGGMAGLLPFLSFIIWRNVMINNGNKMFQFVFFTNTINAIRRFFYFQSRQHRGW
eukprot:jgi/Mesvir1/11201/Mv16594-RA.2